MVTKIRLLVILDCFFVATHAIVSEDFAVCRDSFFHGILPELRSNVENTGKCLCNRYKYGETYYFATSYDTLQRIPFYSAYKITQFRRDDIFDNKRYWRKGEGLRFHEQPRNMDFNNVSKDNLNRGHLAPRFYFSTIEGRKSSDVLTNVGLQYKDINQGTWYRLEQSLFAESRDHCYAYGGESYFITGLLPAEIMQFSTGNISIPGYFWTAFCCDTSKVRDKRNKFKGWSMAYMVENQPIEHNIELFTIRDFLKDKRISKRYVTLFKRIEVEREFPNLGTQYVDNCLFDSKKAEQRMDVIAARMHTPVIFHLSPVMYIPYIPFNPYRNYESRVLSRPTLFDLLIPSKRRFKR